MMPKPCTVPGCPRPSARKKGGLCYPHEYRQSMHLPMDKPVKVAPACSECGGPVFLRGKCEAHYLAWKSALPKRAGKPPCKVAECLKTAVWRGMCMPHADEVLAAELAETRRRESAGVDPWRRQNGYMEGV